MKLLLVRYSIACLRLFVVILQDLHCLQRFYHKVDHWDIITPISTCSLVFVSEIQKCLHEANCCYITLFTEILSQLLSLVYYTLPLYQFSHLPELLLVRYSNACLRLFVVTYVYYKIYIVYRYFITTLIIGVLNFTNVTFSGAFIRQI